MNNLRIFEGREVEVFEFEGKVLFNPRHVGECVRLSEKAVQRQLDRMNKNQIIKLTNSATTNSGIRKLNNAGERFITESGVYKMIFASRSEGAERFQDWVTDDVLPSIRKHDAYMTDNLVDRIYDDPQVMIDLLVKLKNEKEARVEAERRNSILMHTNKTYTATEIAKELGFKSAIALNKDLCDIGFFFIFQNEYMRWWYGKSAK